MTDTLRQSRSPLYLQITEILRQSLSRGIWKPGELLPTISVLAAKYSVAKITVRQAVKILEAEGLLESRRGRGTMALAPPQPRTRLCLGTRLSTLVDMYRGDKPELDLLEEVRATYTGPNAQPGVLTGFYAVKREKIKELADEKLVQMVKSDALELIYYHILSLGNFKSLAKRLPQNATPDAGAETASDEAAPADAES